jgi:hypothetical protein
MRPYGIDASEPERVLCWMGRRILRRPPREQPHVVHDLPGERLVPPARRPSATQAVSTGYVRVDNGYDKASEIVNSTDDMYTGTGGASNAKNVNFYYDGNGRLSRAVGRSGPAKPRKTTATSTTPSGTLPTGGRGRHRAPLPGPEITPTP